MGATVVNSLTASYWAGCKPPGYKNMDLDRALQAYEPLAGKKVTFSNDIMPKTPEVNLQSIDDCITELKGSITALEQAKTSLNQVVSALKAVQSAGFKVSTELFKLSKDKNVDTSRFEAAGTNASSIASMAGSKLADYA